MATKSLTKAQWAEIEQKLSGVFGYVVLLIDGYKVSLVIEKSKMRLYIAVYVDGKVSVKDCLEENDKRMKFYQAKTSYIHDAKTRKRSARISKKNWTIDWNKTHTAYFPWWSSFKPLKRHLEANNDSIELVEES